MIILLTIGHKTELHLPLLLDDPNKNNIDPDKMIEGFIWYLENDRLDILFEFFAKYVRKIHGDRYLKSVIKNNAGISLLDIITPSDVSYMICLIKNSKDVWSQAIDDDEDNSKKVRSLFTSGEGKKRTFGDTTWNKEGLAYFQHGVDVWKLAFQGQMQACEFEAKFEAWMNTTGKAIRLNSKTRMSLYSVLGTTREEDMSSAVARQRSNGDKDEESEAEIIVDYDTDNSGDQTFGGGGEWGKKKPAAARNTSVNETEGNEEEEPDANVEETTVVMSPPVVTRGGAKRDRTTRLASPRHGDGDGDGDESSHRLRDRSRLTPPRKGNDESPVQGRNRQKRNNAQVAEGGGRKKREKNRGPIWMLGDKHVRCNFR